jgi:phosphoribosyl 1,2-cyclic phosphodiesterase
MSLFISSLNSGSNGNCYYVGNHHEAVLIDGGISCRETEKRMKRLGLSMGNVRAIFVSHEHGDHIHGVPALAKKFQLPVYITAATLRNSNIEVDSSLVVNFSAFVPVHIGRLTVTAIPKHHDAADPHSFVVESETVKVGVFTDIGYACNNVRTSFAECHAAFLESNYDEEMLERGHYSPALKNRIRGGYGHLSNTQALKLFRANRRGFMSHLFLSHLSAENNTPEMAIDLFKKDAGKTEIILAPRNGPTRLYHIRNLRPDKSKLTTRPVYYVQKQLTLF